MEGQFLKTNGQGHCFLAPAKLPRSAILNNVVNKIVTAIKKIVEIYLAAAEPTSKWRHTVNICLQRKQYIFTIFKTEVKVTVFCLNSRFIDF